MMGDILFNKDIERDVNKGQRNIVPDLYLSINLRLLNIITFS